MKKIYQSFILLTILLFGCETDQFEKGGSSDDSIQLAFTLSGTSLTKANTTPGDNQLNENAIKTLDVLIYESSGTSCQYYEQFSQLSLATTDEFRVDLKAKKDRFTLNTSYIVYVIANLNTSITIPAEGVTLIELQNLITSSQLKPSEVQETFLMDGMSTASILNDNGNGQKTVTVNLQRAAAKIRVAIQYKSGFGPGTNLTPQKKIMNYVDQTRVISSGNLPATPSRIAQSNLSDISTVEIEGGTLPGFIVYSYENDWNDNANHETYIIVNIPQDTKPENYYKIPVNYRLPSDSDDPASSAADLRKVKRNHLYDIAVTIDKEGSRTPDDPVEVEGTYSVKNWEIVDFSAKFPSNHWLFVKENEIRMVNIDVYPLEYSADLPIRIENVTAKYMHISFEGVETEEEYIKGTEPDYPTGHFPVFEVDPVDFIIKIKSLVPVNYVPLTIEFDVTTDANLTEHVIVNQYPNQYITARLSKGDVIPEWYKETDDDDQTNYNFFTITTLHSDRYILGDPTFNTGITDHTAAVDSMISPRFIIASQHGVSDNGLHWLYANKRCEDYGEDTYRSGWRIPTIGELELINAIQADDNSAIKKLFYGRAYWSAKTNWFYKMSKWDRNIAKDGDPADIIKTEWMDQVPEAVASPDGWPIQNMDGVYDMRYENGTYPGTSPLISGSVRCIYDDY